MHSFPSIYKMRVITKLSDYASVIVYLVYGGTDPLSLRKKRSSAKLENTSLSADVF